MKITALDSWHSAPGTTIEWHPTVDSVARTAHASPTSGGLTFLAENHVRGAHVSARNGRPHLSYIGSGTTLDGVLNEAAMTSALTQFVARHSILRMWFDVEGGTVVSRSLPADAVEFEATVGSRLTNAADVHDHIRARLGAETRSDSYPGFAFGAIVREDDFSIFFGADHALSDGSSQALALTEIVGLYRRALADPEDTSTPVAESASGGFAEYAQIEATLAAAHVAGTSEFTAWKDTFTRNDLQMPRFALDLGLAPGETAPVKPIELPLLDRAGIAGFDRACKAAGGRFLAGLYAALAITDHELGGVDNYYGMTVFDCRAMLPTYAADQGWICSFAPVEFAVSGASTFSELVPRANVGYERAKKLATVPVGAAMAAMMAAGASPEAVVTAPNMLSYIDFRWFPGCGDDAYDRGFIFTGEGRTGNASLWINRDHDSVYLGSQTPDTPFAQYQVRRYFEHLAAVIDRVAQIGERVISPTTDRPCRYFDRPVGTRNSA